MLQQPIGVFDSGFGGLTVLKEIVTLLPEYDYIYLGDNARAPYGTKDFETVYRYTLQCVTWFFSQGCPLVILACNTASAKALRTIQQNDLGEFGLEKRVLGVIRPTSEIIGEYTINQHVGIVGTTGTVQSGSYLLEIEKFFPEITVTQEACPAWVDLVENNQQDSDAALESVQHHVGNLLNNDPEIDSILLGCTHYPLLLRQIKRSLPPGINIISQGSIVAESLKHYLQRHPLLASACSKHGNRSFFTTGREEHFNNRASAFFGSPILASHLDLEG